MIKVGTIVQTPSKLIGIVISNQDKYVVAFNKWKGSLYSAKSLKEVTHELEPKTLKDITEARKYYKLDIEANGSEDSSRISS